MADKTNFDKKKEAGKKALKSAKEQGPGKGKNPEIRDPVKVDFEPALEGGQKLEEDFSYIIATNPDLFEDTIVEEYLTEVLSIAGRMKRRQQIRRFKSRMEISRKRAMKRRASQAKIGGRARRTAISNMKRRLSGGRSSKQMTYSERARVERLVSRRKAAITRQTRRLIIKKRALERQRMSGGARKRR